MVRDETKSSGGAAISATTAHRQGAEKLLLGAGAIQAMEHRHKRDDIGSIPDVTAPSSGVQGWRFWHRDVGIVDVLKPRTMSPIASTN